jgi:hypothetical protein
MPPHRFKDVKKIGWTERSKMYLERFEEWSAQSKQMEMIGNRWMCPYYWS